MTLRVSGLSTTLIKIGISKVHLKKAIYAKTLMYCDFVVQRAERLQQLIKLR